MWRNKFVYGVATSGDVIGGTITVVLYNTDFTSDIYPLKYAPASARGADHPTYKLPLPL
jgi:hypothetical protein